jgi:lysophospholipase L1-like esterase
VTVKLAILGDSHAAGLGVRGRSYAILLAERLPGAEVLQLARTTQTVAEIGPDTVARVREFAPDLVVVAFGAAEGFVHPSRFLQRVLDRFAPKSWQGVAGLEPRPYFSGRLWRRLRQRVVSGGKVLVKRTIIAVTGGYRRVPAKEFAERIQELLAALGPDARTLVVGLWQVDERMFPRSNRQLRRNDEILSAAAREHGAVFVPAAGLHCWDDFLADHAHLNERGHRHLAELLRAHVRHLDGSRVRR